MSASKAHKAANRSMLKKVWNANVKPSITPKQPAPKDSWWTVAAAPDARAAFMLAAKTRDTEKAWTNIVPHAMNPSRNLL